MTAKDPEVKVELRDFGAAEERREAVIVGLEKNARELGDRLAALDRAGGGAVTAALESGDFSGRLKQTITLRPATASGPERIVIVGLGESKQYGAEPARKALTAALRDVAGLGVGTAAVDLASFAISEVSGEKAAELAAETVRLALWRNLAYRSELKEEEERKLSAVHLLWSEPEGFDGAEAAARCANVVALATCYARELVARPANELYPEALAQEAMAVAGRRGYAFSLLEAGELKRLGMNALLAVGAGSSRPPCLIVVDTAPDSGQKPIALVGKGLTFDSGGISIKPAKQMEEMKGDMAGAAAVLGALDALGGLGFARRVVALIPAAENMPGPTAQRPGDIWKTLAGINVEVIDTDAEGRLVLADALAYAVENYSPEMIIDLATLTGACVVALGFIASGLFCTDDSLCRALVRAGESTHERLWRLPLFEEYGELLKSEIADIKNIGGRWGGAVIAAMFLKRFVGDVPWAHVDIAGPAWLPKAQDYLPAGPTGVGVRLLVETLTRELKPNPIPSPS